MPWSAWQDGFEFEAAGNYQSGSGAATATVSTFIIGSTAGTDMGYSDLADAIADIPAQFGAALAPTSDLSAGTGSGNWQQLFSAQQLLVDIPEILTFVALIQMVATVIDPDYSTDPPPPVLPPGVTVFEYEGDATRIGWADWTLDEETGGLNNISGSVAVVEGDTNATEFFDDWAPYDSFRIVDPADLDYATLVSAETGGTVPASLWPAPGLGTEAGRLTSVLSTSGNTVTTNLTVPMDLASDAASFTVLVQPSSIIDGTSPTLHAPTPSGGDTFRTGEASDQLIETFRAPPPNVRYVTSRWRYMITDAVYIFGGHWQRIPGTPDVMVKKTDGTWIPIVDGLAPPLL